MNIGLDYISESSRSAGSKTYGRKLLESLARLYPQDRFQVFINEESLESFHVDTPNVNYVTSRFDNSTAFLRRIAQQTWLPLAVKKHPVDLLHSINNVVPFSHVGRKLITIYDMTSFVYPERFTWAKRSYLKALVPLSAKASDRIVTISEYAKRQIVNYCSVSGEKVEVAYCGIDTATFENGTNRGKYNFPDHFVLFVGTLEPGKNIVRLIKAFSSITPKVSPNLKLLIVGRPGWLYDEIYTAASQAKCSDRIIFAGKLSNADLGEAYRRAKLLAFPSLDEGFGLPVLEAMAMGCPVVTSNVSALPEIAGKAAILVDPENEHEIAAALLKILFEPNLAQNMSQIGREWSRNFRWDATARKIHDLYVRMLK